MNVITNQTSAAYYNTVINNGFVPINTKVTRMHNGAASLIDHMLANEPYICCNSGSIVDDISDHWPTFLQLNPLKQSKFFFEFFVHIWWTGAL
jgi:hypothetical protein